MDDVSLELETMKNNISNITPKVEKLVSLNPKDVEIRFVTNSYHLTNLQGENSYPFISLNGINELFGVTDASNENCMVLFINGEGANVPQHLDGCTYLNGNFYAVFSSTFTSSDFWMRISALVIYSKTPIKDFKK